MNHQQKEELQKKGFTFFAPQPTLGFGYQSFVHSLENARIIVSLGSFIHTDIKIPRFLRILLAMLMTTQRLYSEKKQEALQEIHEEPRKLLITDTALKVILLMIGKIMFSCESSSYYQMAAMLFFRPELVCSLLSLIVSRSNLILVEDLMKFCDSLLLPTFNSNLIGSLYMLLGGGIFKIQRERFEEKLTVLLNKVNDYLQSPTNFVFKFLKSQDEEVVNKVRDHLERYIELLTICKSAPVSTHVKQYSSKIFGSKNQLTRQEFIMIMEQRKKGKMEIGFFLLQILRIETHLSQVFTEGSHSPSNDYFVKAFQRLLKKCPYNGDSECQCKKCQCIRRNRNSASLNQQKKREAISLVGPLTSKVTILEQRNQRLQQENQMLKKLVVRLSQRTEFQDTLREQIQSSIKSLFVSL